VKRGCTQCGECLNVCPVFRQHYKEEYSPKGKRILMEPVDNGDANAISWDEVFAFARLCAGCGRCEKACARKLSTADIIADVRAKNPHWTQRFWEMWIKHMGPLWPSIGLMASLVPEAVTPKLLETSLATAKALREKSPAKPWVRIAPETPVPGKKIMLFFGCTAKNVRRE
jgi:glycolate oxidase iron-sulfur subunit